MSTHTQNTNGTYPGPTPFGAAPGTTWTPGNPVHAFGPQGGPVANPAAWGFHPYAHPAFYSTPAFGFHGFHPGFNPGTPTPAFVNSWGFQPSPTYGFNAWNPWGTPASAWWNTPFGAPAPVGWNGWNTPTGFPFGFGMPGVGYASPFPYPSTAPFGAPVPAWNATAWWNAGPVGARPATPIPGYGAERTVAGACCATREAA